MQANIGDSGSEGNDDQSDGDSQENFNELQGYFTK